MSTQSGIFISLTSSSGKGKAMADARSGFTVVSGVGGRIGLAVAQTLLGASKPVVGLDIHDRAWDTLVQDYPGLFLGFSASVTDVTVMGQALDAGEAQFGPVTGAVHAAYPRTDDWGAPFDDVSPDSLKENLFGQLGGTLLFSREVVTRMRHHQGGSVVLISSIQGIRAPRFDHYEGLDMSSPAEYSAVKAGVIGFSRWLAKNVASTNIRVNCVSPGGIVADQPELFQQRYRADCLTKGLLDPEDVVGAIGFLLSDDSRYVSGQNIVVDDGWSL
jgi:NAD(P)-dependent dehydrogenase (short-subunit alcohol dehydrogenase family)